MLGGVTRRRVLGLLAVGLIAAAAGLALHAAGLLNWLERIRWTRGSRYAGVRRLRAMWCW